ncbi:unnamed protein product [Hermetia illucens]|uniref:AAA+ ATPase domain-containing protein n=1 Tax=Hermetia illucens TaxID=343691 RepID=A0A7R8UX45_HERIL|nr:fidgetin-like protein 1 [Hermetia illucens]CAD7088648.1 unnamed protein product [Hermetia illucens]
MESEAQDSERSAGVNVMKDITETLKSTTDNFKRANLLRETAFVLHRESSKDSEELGSLFLGDVLESYKGLVTSTGEGSVNNYTDRVVHLLKKSKRPVDLSKWKTTICSRGLPEGVHNKCEGEYEDCKHREVSDVELESFHLNFGDKAPKRKLEAVDAFNECKSGSNQFADEIFEKESLSVSTILMPSEIPQRPVIADDPKTTKTYPKVPLDFQPNIDSPIYPRDRSNTNAVKSGVAVEPPPPTVSSFRTARDELTLQNFRKYGNKASVEPSSSGFISNQRLFEGQNHRQSPPSNQNFTSTGYTAQHNQQQQKGYQHQPLFSYGASKKSLGARRTVQSKFIPPVKNAPEGSANLAYDGQTAGEGDEFVVADERLRNIEPKMVELISNEIMSKLKPVGWDDIAGLEYAKSTIQEAVVWPMLRPDIFTGLRRPPRGILLFGPPGTGKTLIGKCIASQSNSTFFSISASSLTSKWIGDGEKMVRALFAVAAVNQPSVIFIDEVDSLLCQRSETEHESSRRIKTEFLVQLDGAMTSEEERILIVGATNRPQELDEAARRRFTRRLYIPLPEQEARLQILRNLLRSVRHSLSDADIESIGLLANGYSGADMESLCREASMEPIRSIPPTEILYFNENEVRPIDLNDFRKALNRIRASVSQSDLQQYVDWNEIYGSGAIC